MGSPAAATGVGIEQERLEAIERIRKTGFGRLARFKLIPERTEDRPLIRGQHAKEPIRRRALTFIFRRVCCGIVREGITGIDLNQIVDDDQLKHSSDVHSRRRILTERQRGEREVPGMLRGIFNARIVGERRSSKNGFQSIGLDQERELLCESSVGHG